MDCYPLENKIDLKLVQMGEQRCAPGHSCGVFDRSGYLIHFICSGKGRYVCGGREYKLGQGQAFLITNERDIYYEADSHDPWYYKWFEICGSTAEKFLQRCGLSIDNPIFNPLNPKAVEECITSLINTYASVFAGDISFIGMSECLRLLSVMEENSDAEIQQSGSPGRTYVEMAKNYVYINLNKKIRISDICRNIGIERSYLYRLFEEYEGKSPRDYVIDYKLRRAKNILLEGRMSVAEAAAAVGYDDQSAFSKLFSAKFGISPKEMKKIKALKKDSP